MSALTLRNARIVLAGEVIEGSLVCEDGIIAAIDSGPSLVGEDMDGDYVIPGLVELHTDHLENHYRPRPGVFWNPSAALQAHDVQIAGSGITTVFDAVRIGSDAEIPGMGEHVEVLVEAIGAAKSANRLRAEHFIHLRCELPSHDVVDDFDRFCDLDLVKLASVMDHTPGQRQYQTIEKYVLYYKERMHFSDAQMAAFIAERQAEHVRYSEKHRQAIMTRGLAAGIAFASHDDATHAQVATSLEEGVSIAEFPTTLEAARASHQAGLAVLMGAPNLVRGGSHSGNVSALELAEAGLLDILSSDYVPFALMHAAFLLAERVDAIVLPEAIATVTSAPAKAAKLDDRGVIAPGKRADLVRVQLDHEVPMIRSVWRQGLRVS